MFKYKMKLIFEINDFAGDRSVAVWKTPLLHLAEVKTFLRCLWTLFEKHLWGENIFEMSLNIIWKTSLRWEHLRDIFEHYLKFFKTSDVRTYSRCIWTLFEKKHLWGETIFRYLWTLFEHQASLKYLWNIFETIVDIFENSLKHPWNILVTRDFDFQSN